MAFSSDITHLPRVFDPLTTPPIQGLPDDLSRLVQAAASASPYLARLIEREPDIPAALVEGSVEALFQTTLAAVSEDVVDPARHLRRLKGRAALLTALADLSGVWPLDRVTMALSQFADAVVDATLKDLVRTAVERGALPETRAPAGGLFAIAMGKLGALELNYSSDIDLILLFDEAVYPKAAYADIRATLVRVAKELVRRLSAQTGDGYVFRVDLRLRPDASVTPLVIGMEAAERYYEAEGRSWERAAMIKARAVAGDTGAAARFLEALRPFVWRRSLDFATIEDVADMRRRIRHHRGLNGPLSLPGHNIKLGRGGIREIEFLAQTLQLIHGGRDPGLRARATRAALSALANRGLITREAASTLDTAYVAHRTLENRLQMLNDAQTHTVPQAPEARARLAALYGAEDVEAFEDSALTHLKRVEAVSTTLFAPEPSLADRQSPWAGFADAAAAEARARHWRRLPALRSGRATEFFRRIEPRIAARLGEALSPDDALLSFDSFLRRLPAGVQVFALFDANPTLLELMVDLCSRAPRLAEHLGQRPDVLDVVLAPGFFDLPSGADHLATELEADLREIGDYERMLDRIRIWAREQQFRVGVQLLQGIATAEEARRAYADIADASLRTLLPVTVAEHSERYGPPPGEGLAVLAMGGLGVREMTATSDLDLIMIYDAPPEAVSTGPKPLAAPVYYARLIKSFIAALTAPTAEGVLYEVDMRLRPSGRQGPVATSLRSFARYQAEDAWTWEHLALSRARVVAGPAPLAEAIRAAITASLADLSVDKVLRDTREMRARIASAKPRTNVWDVKAGAGGMLDIDLCLQAGTLVTGGAVPAGPREMGLALRAAGWLDLDAAGCLGRSHDLQSAVLQLFRVALDGAIERERIGPGLAQTLMRASGARDLDTLEARLEADMAAAAALIDRQLDA